ALPIPLKHVLGSQASLSALVAGPREPQARPRPRRSPSPVPAASPPPTHQPHTPEDTGEYLAVRLRRAGFERELFPRDSVTLLHEATGGALRDLDRLAATCLRHAARKRRKTVDRDIVSVVLKNAAR